MVAYITQYSNRIYIYKENQLNMYNHYGLNTAIAVFAVYNFIKENTMGKKNTADIKYFFLLLKNCISHYKYCILQYNNDILCYN